MALKCLFYLKLVKFLNKNRSLNKISILSYFFLTADINISVESVNQGLCLKNEPILQRHLRSTHLNIYLNNL